MKCLVVSGDSVCKCHLFTASTFWPGLLLVAESVRKGCDFSVESQVRRPSLKQKGGNHFTFVHLVSFAFTQPSGVESQALQCSRTVSKSNGSIQNWLEVGDYHAEKKKGMRPAFRYLKVGKSRVGVRNTDGAGRGS